MSTIITAILGAIGGACGGAIFAWVALGAQRVGGLHKVIRALSHDALFTRCEMLLKAGKISTDDLENLDMLYDAYKDLGMNGAGAELYNRCKSLPLE